LTIKTSTVAPFTAKSGQTGLLNGRDEMLSMTVLTGDKGEAHRFRGQALLRLPVCSICLSAVYNAVN